MKVAYGGGGMNAKEHQSEPDWNSHGFLIGCCPTRSGNMATAIESVLNTLPDGETGMTCSEIRKSTGLLRAPAAKVIKVCLTRGLCKIVSGDGTRRSPFKYARSPVPKPSQSPPDYQRPQTGS